MEGSFEKPPIVIRTSRWKLLVELAGCTTLFLMGLLVIVTEWREGTPIMDVWAAYGLAIMFGPAIPFGVYVLFRPSILKLSPEGLTIDTPFIRRAYSWPDISDAYIWHQRLYFGVGYMKVPMALVGGRSRGLGLLWEVRPTALVSLVNEARTRWREGRKD